MEGVVQPRLRAAPFSFGGSWSDARRNLSAARLRSSRPSTPPARRAPCKPRHDFCASTRLISSFLETGRRQIPGFRQPPISGEQSSVKNAQASLYFLTALPFERPSGGRALGAGSGSASILFSGVTLGASSTFVLLSLAIDFTGRSGLADASSISLKTIIFFRSLRWKWHAVPTIMPDQALFFPNEETASTGQYG